MTHRGSSHHNSTFDDTLGRNVMGAAGAQTLGIKAHNHSIGRNQAAQFNATDATTRISFAKQAQMSLQRNHAPFMDTKNSSIFMTEASMMQTSQ